MNVWSWIGLGFAAWFAALAAFIAAKEIGYRRRARNRARAQTRERIDRQFAEWRERTEIIAGFEELDRKVEADVTAIENSKIELAHLMLDNKEGQ